MELELVVEHEVEQAQACGLVSGVAELDLHVEEEVSASEADLGPPPLGEVLPFVFHELQQANPELIVDFLPSNDTP